MGKEFRPVIRHIDNRNDLQLWKRLLRKFGMKVADIFPENLSNYKEWKNEDKLAELRSELLRITKEALEQRKDPVTNSLQKNEVDKRNDPYVKIAFLAMLIDYHVDEQLKQIESILGD